ncbi:unnamed protein product [Clavelina lepadiformis]|uniref:NIPA-like protein 2 n=1 Tax=Clavelina lepadiformis TaxID=159417 RepID=A0ABP0FKQ3_CLALP
MEMIITESYNATTSSHTNTTIPAEPNVAFDGHELIGLALALGGNLLISISLTVQKKAHNRLGQDSGMKYCLDKWWWLGMFLMIGGELGNFMAYGFAPASLVAPLGSVAVIANAIIAFVFLREPISMPSMMGVTLVIVGSVTLISFSARGSPTLTSVEIVTYLQAWTFLLYVGIEIVVLAILLYLKFVRGNEHLIILLLLVAIIASITIIAAKAVSTMISETIFQGRQQILNAFFWVSLIILPITTATQIRFLNRAMQLYDVSDVVPVNFIFFTISAILAGAIFYKEFKGVAFDRIFIFLFGCILSFIGVYIIAHQDEYKEKKEENRNRTGTGDSGLDPGSSDGSSSSFSSEILTLSDSEASASGNAISCKDKRESAIISRNKTPEHSETTKLVENPRRTSESWKNVFYEAVKALKSSTVVKLVQPSN